MIGTRHGEKLYEALLSREEMVALKTWATITVCRQMGAT
jgi:FlaA1/EpsC-like NDP-sugar epimerase